MDKFLNELPFTLKNMTEAELRENLYLDDDNDAQNENFEMESIPSDNDSLVPEDEIADELNDDMNVIDPVPSFFSDLDDDSEEDTITLKELQSRILKQKQQFHQAKTVLDSLNWDKNNPPFSDILEFTNEDERAVNDKGTEAESVQFEEILVDTQHKIILPKHITCASHTLSLIATSDLNKLITNSPVGRVHHPAYAKCVTLWNLSRRPKSSEKIVTTLGCSLQYTCITRWNSLYDCTLQLLQHKEKLNIVCKELDIPCFKDVEMIYLEELCTVLRPLANAIDILQGENVCFYGELLPTLFSLKARLENLQSRDLRFTEPLAAGLINALHARYLKYFQLSPEVNEAILASCVHPAFKMKWLPDMEDSERKRLQNLCIQAVEQLNVTNEDPGSSEDFYIFTKPNENCDFAPTMLRWPELSPTLSQRTVLPGNAQREALSDNEEQQSNNQPIPTADIKNILVKWKAVQEFTNAHYPDSAEANRINDLYSSCPLFPADVGEKRKTNDFGQVFHETIGQKAENG
ncbi:transposase-related [Holotrichia oblita]|nr:transposase-related [Holotrichia oblita]